MKIKREKLRTLRPFQLLEVLIAMTLLLLTLPAIMSLHMSLFKSESESLREIEINHQANLVFSDLLVRLYENQIPWETIISQEEEQFTEINMLGKTYKVTQQFLTEKEKKIDDGIAYFFNLILKFIPNSGKSQEYHYKLFIKKNMAAENDH